MRVNRPLFLDMSFLANEPQGKIEFEEEENIVIVPEEVKTQETTNPKDGG